MSLIDDVKRDRENGTPGPWVKSGGRGTITAYTHQIDSAALAGVAFVSYSDKTDAEHRSSLSDARRIARVPDLEAALLAAEEMQKRLADCVAYMDTREKMVPGMPRVCDMAREALAAYREATK